VYNRITKALGCLLILVLLAPTGVFAYSYGDPSQEDVAETFKLIVAKLNASTPDWAGALDAYKVRRSEIASHFGEPIALTLDANFEAKKKEALIDNYKAVLVLNMKRRFDYVEKDINDYSKAKLLLAKAKGTFDVLQPYVEAKIPNEVSSIVEAFNLALEALGNPGLFGVGQIPVNEEEYKKQVGYIHQTLKPLFAFSEAKTEPKEEPKDKATVSEKKEETAKPKSTSQARTDNTVASNTSNKESASSSESAKEETSVTTSQQTSTDTTDSSNDAAQQTDTQADQTDSSTEQQEESSTEGSTSSEATTTESTSAAADTNSMDASQKTHDPMERSNKTSPLVTFLVIGGVAAAGLGAFWFAKKKGII
jgi:chemotaxis protein histidine kinase CheA